MMNPKEPVPPVRSESLRRQMIKLLEDGIPRSAREVSGALGISEKEVVTHLAHVRKSLGQSKQRLVVEPPVCRQCGFSFSKRHRLTKPGKCPQCRATSVQEPLFYIT